jgi:hypothetical protein
VLLWSIFLNATRGNKSIPANTVVGARFKMETHDHAIAWRIAERKDALRPLAQSTHDAHMTMIQMSKAAKHALAKLV